MVYHSHVLEHFSQEDGELLIRECYRVLKPGGVLRVVVPDLEQIAINYLKYLQLSLDNPSNREFIENYKWMVIEMFDQTVRNESGGNMLKYLSNSQLINEEFIFSRIGEEGKSIRKSLFDVGVIENRSLAILRKIKIFIKSLMTMGQTKEYKIGRFRLGGEIHQWMYDRLSISLLLKKINFNEIVVVDESESYIDDWNFYGLDKNDNLKRKPDSLYIEAVK
jgi:SAM-dependent methyltransferase